MARQASLTSESEAQQRRENAEEAALQQALKMSSAHHVEATKAAEDAKTIDRRCMLQALLQSSDMYAQELHVSWFYQSTNSRIASFVCREGLNIFACRNS
jgi:hypothetical protein